MLRPLKHTPALSQPLSQPPSITHSTRSNQQVWVRPYVNKRLPYLNVEPSAVLGRPISLGTARWVLPSGASGLTPVVKLDQCSVGPSSQEKSTLDAASISLWIRPLASLLQRKIVMALTLHAPQINAVQAANFSWMGFPEDTEPSSRQFGAIKAAAEDEGHVPMVRKSPSLDLG